MKRVLIIIFIILTVNFIYAICENGQIDINTASLTELDEIKWVGESTAQDIIDNRPYSSLEELKEKVDYIGESRFEDIKNEGLACVADEENIEEENNENNVIEGEEVEDEEPKITSNVVDSSEPETQNVTFDVISLGTKDIKNQETNEDEENQKINKNKLIMLGFVGFSLLIGLLLMLKKRKYIENEFR